MRVWVWVDGLVPASFFHVYALTLKSKFRKRKKFSIISAKHVRKYFSILKTGTISSAPFNFQKTREKKLPREKRVIAKASAITSTNYHMEFVIGSNVICSFTKHYHTCAILWCAEKVLFQYMHKHKHTCTRKIYGMCATVCHTSGAVDVSFLFQCACLLENTFALFVHSASNRS